MSNIIFFENPESLAIGVFIILFILGYIALIRVLKAKGPALIAAFAIALIASWKLYQERFYEWEGALAVLLIAAVAVIILRILWAFVKGARGSFKG